MLTFLFWNMGNAPRAKGEAATPQSRQNRLAQILANLTAYYDADVVIVAECPLAEPEFLRAVNRGGHPEFHLSAPNSSCARIKIYARFPPRFLRACDETSYYSGRHVKLPARESFLLYAVHLPSKRNQGEDSQAQQMPEFSRMIRSRERFVGHERTILVGDFNMNPFETGMVSAQGLNAVMSRDVARKQSRVHLDEETPFFYNPMWGQFGDRTHDEHPIGSEYHSPPGTCYYSAAESKWYYWNMFDQVMVRPALLDQFRSADLRIVVTDGQASLLNRAGRPDREQISDHLPILFRVDI